MPAARQYSETEVRGMLQIVEGNVNLASKTPVPADKRAPAHAIGLHGGSDHLSMVSRVLDPKSPNKTSVYKDFDTQVRATTELLNSAAGQTELAKLDAGTEKRVRISGALTNGSYYGAVTQKNNATVTAATGKTTTSQNFKRATHGRVICEKFVGDILQIQTSFPETLA